MNFLMLFACAVPLIAAGHTATITSTSGTPAKVELPAGNLNGASGTCPVEATSATLTSGDQEWTMEIGDRLAFPAARGDRWKIVCAAEVGKGTTSSNMSGTKCFFDGYMVAGFESGAMRIACYEGEIPESLQ